MRHHGEAGMSTTTATRTPNQRGAAPIGTGHLHQALEDARDLAKLHAFCAATSCTEAEVSSDGVRLDMLRVLDLMRARGYGASSPTKSQHQPRQGFTAWVVDVALPGPGARFAMGFYTPNLH